MNSGHYSGQAESKSPLMPHSLNKSKADKTLNWVCKLGIFREQLSDFKANYDRKRHELFKALQLNDW